MSAVYIGAEGFRKLAIVMKSLEAERQPWWQLWRDLADYLMPKRMIWLQGSGERTYLARNPKILDPTGTHAGKVLVSGMMNGITPASRPWIKLRLHGFEDDLDSPARRWLDEVERRMMLVMAQSNFYSAMAIAYIDLVFFGTASMLIYEDYTSVIRCYNCAIGEYFLGQDSRQQVNRFARKFDFNLDQVVEYFGEENLSETLRVKYRGPNYDPFTKVQVGHIIEPNDGRYGGIPQSSPFREIYWELNAGLADTGQVLSKRGFNELPGVWARWEVTGNDAYGTPPALDCLGDIIQLQHETMRKAQALDKVISPPMLADIQLANKVGAFLPGQTTFVQGLANHGGAKPAVEIRPDLQALSADIRDVQTRIQLGFYNNLFNDIMNLDTVRSATEIDARREEKLTLLGPVLDRFESEALDPAVRRIYGVMSRAKLLPEPPPEIAGAEIQIQYVSILAFAQTAAGVAPTERFLQVTGNMAAVWRDAADIPNIDNLLSEYARDLGVPASGVNSKEEVAAMREQRAAAESAQPMAETAETGANAAKLLSETQVGGGDNALQYLLGNA